VIQKIASVLACLILCLVAAIHIYWALGGYWPGHDEASLVAMVIGSGSRKMPPVVTLLVSLSLLVGAWLVLAIRGYLRPPWPSRLFTVAGWVMVGVFALRGTLGMFACKIRPADPGAPFEILNLIIYSPLCLVIAALIVVFMTRRAPGD
jgi:phosphate/sulfate permease